MDYLFKQEEDFNMGGGNIPKTRRKTRRSLSLEKYREGAINFRMILRNNIIITATTGMTLLFILPLLAKTLYSYLWIYAHDNINIGGIFGIEVLGDVFLGGLEDVIGDPGEAVGGLVQAIVGSIIYQLLGTLILELRWIETYMRRIIRFMYLSILATMIIFLFMYFILSLIMNHKVKLKGIILSSMVGSVIAFGIAFFWIPNDPIIMEMLRELVLSFNKGDPFKEVPLLVIDILYAFWIGFVILVVLNLIITTLVEYALRDF